MTGSDLTSEWKTFEVRADALPADYQAAWEQIKVHLSPYSGFTGRNLMPILDGALGLLYKEIQRYFFKVGPADLPDGHLLSGIVDFFEEGAAAGKGVLELIGNDVAAFCDDLVKEPRPYANI